MSLIVWALFTLRRLRKRWRGHPEHGYISHYAEMLQLVLVPYLIAGAFLTVAYFDLYFHLMSTVVILELLSANAQRAQRLFAVPRQGSTRAVRGSAIVPSPVPVSRASRTTANA
jgi:hypothetical protein